MQLSEHFTLAEMTYSETAARLAIPNVPDAAGIAKLRLWCRVIGEPIRAHFGKPVKINSGYRSPRVNKAVGGAATSQHVVCEAGDLEVPGIANIEVARFVREALTFDQLILEAYTPGVPSSGWVHVSLRKGANRGEVLTMQRLRKFGILRTVYLKGLVA